MAITLAALAGCGGGSSGSSSIGSTPGTTPSSGPPVSTPTPIPNLAPTVGVAELQWTAPTKNEDGSALTNLAGYKVRYGTSPTELTAVLNISSPATNNARLEGLYPGTWYFTVASYTNTGAESAPTGTASKTIT